MKEPDNLQDLVGEDLSPDELARLERVDSLLRSVPGPPHELPSSLTRSVDIIGLERSRPTRRRLGLTVAFAAVLAAAAFGFGRWTADEGFDARAVVSMQPTDVAPQAVAVIQIGERDEATGNWKLRLEVDGLPELGGEGYYVLWLAKEGDYAGTCGTFRVSGRTTVDMTASYQLKDYDAWVISESRDDAPWLLQAKIS
jgi:hypothetical protein